MSNVTLLNDGGWYFLERVTFPVEVEGVLDHVEGLGTCANVSTIELKRIGAKFDWCCDDDEVWSFVLGSECEVYDEIRRV